MIYDRNTHSCLWYLNFIATPSFFCPKLDCIELLISLHNDRYLFADGFVTMSPIAMKFGWDKENVSCLKFKNFAWIRQVLTGNYRWNLIWKKLRLPHLEPRCRTGWCNKSIYIAHKVKSYIHFMHPPKIVQIGWKHHVNFCVWKKSTITFGEGCRYLSLICVSKLLI